MWNQCKYKIILASNSPRRKELLAGLGIRFEVKILPDIKESYPEALPPSKVAEYISRKKAAEYMDEMRRGELLITADTIVVLEGEIMGKPGDIDEADAPEAFGEDSSSVYRRYVDHGRIWEPA